MNYEAKWSLIPNPKKLPSIAVKRLLDRALYKQGIRHTLVVAAEVSVRNGKKLWYNKFY
jgi:hypothetical protein